jgi:hypothetical protein
VSRLLKGYEEYLKYSNDPNLNKNNLFFIFDSFIAWDKEGGRDIPKNKIILKELELNRFLAHP